MTTRPSGVILRFARALGRRIRRGLNYVEWAVDRWVVNRWYRFPRAAADNVWLRDLGYEGPERNSYGPSSWGVLRGVLDKDEITGDDVFLDLGCGMGRVVFEAARYPFGRVIGVDIVPELISAAREAIERNRDRLRCQEVELVVADAVTYELPYEVTTVYLADPFTGSAFERVLANIIDLADRRADGVSLIYYEPSETDTLEKSGRATFIRCWRRGFRFWAPRDFVKLYRIGPAT